MHTERELAKSFGRLHLHPAEAALWGRDTKGFMDAIIKWGHPPSMSILTWLVVFRVNEDDLKLEAIGSLLDLHANDRVPLAMMEEFFIGLLESKSFGNRKNLTRMLVTAFEMVKEHNPGLMTDRVQVAIQHQGVVNEAAALLALIGVRKGGLSPTPAVMFTLTDACTVEAFEWVKPYKGWSNAQKAEFSNLFLAYCIRRHPSNLRQKEVLKHIWGSGMPKGVNLLESDLRGKECIRATVLECRITVQSSLLAKAPGEFKLKMLKAKLTTSEEAKVKSRLIDKMISIDLGL